MVNKTRYFIYFYIGIMIRVLEIPYLNLFIINLKEWLVVVTSHSQILYALDLF